MLCAIRWTSEPGTGRTADFKDPRSTSVPPLPSAAVTLLMYLHLERDVLVMTDTLVTNTAKDPFIFRSKCYTFPNLRMVMAGTGAGPLPERWFTTIQTSMLVANAEMLHAHAPIALRSIWAELQAEHVDFGTGTGTIYHFALDEDGAAVRYRYRSTHDFEGERFTTTGFGIKPEPEGDFASPASVDEMIALARRTRAEQDARAVEERVCIGGELMLTSLREDGTIVSTVVHQFEDYWPMFLAMEQRLDESG